MMPTQLTKNFVGGDARARVVICFLNLLPPEFVESFFLTLKCAQSRADDLAGRAITTRLHSRVDTFLEFAESDGNRFRAAHSRISQAGEYDFVI